MTMVTSSGLGRLSRLPIFSISFLVLIPELDVYDVFTSNQHAIGTRNSLPLPIIGNPINILQVKITLCRLT